MCRIFHLHDIVTKISESNKRKFRFSLSLAVDNTNLPDRQPSSSWMTSGTRQPRRYLLPCIPAVQFSGKSPAESMLPRNSEVGGRSRGAKGNSTECNIPLVGNLPFLRRNGSQVSSLVLFVFIALHSGAQWEKLTQNGIKLRKKTVEEC